MANYALRKLQTLARPSYPDDVGFWTRIFGMEGLLAAAAFLLREILANVQK